MPKELRVLAVGGYPTEKKPDYEVFVRALLMEMRHLGASIEVINPQTIWNLAKRGSPRSLAPRIEIRDGIRISRPIYTSYSNIALPLGINTRTWSDRSYVRAATRAFRQLDAKFDVVFGHFLYPHARAAIELAKMLRIPAVASLGESSFERYEHAYNPSQIGSLLRRFQGIYANSPLIRDYCVQQFGISRERIQVFPNGVSEDFYPRDRTAARRSLALPTERPIVAFVGQLIERKGPLRLLEAIRNRPEIGAVFLGDGPQKPLGPQVLFQGSVAHDAVPVWLSAADIFVLPTLAEGCSNAILEAISCGLPVVSSDLPFNRVILDQRTALLVDPMDSDAISTAISYLIDNPNHRHRLSQAALQHASTFSLRDRALRILDYLESCTP